MPDSIWDAALGSFNNDLAGRSPAPAAGSAAAVSGRFAVSLLIKILDISARHKSFSGRKAAIVQLQDSAQGCSQLLAQAADQDAIAFTAYLDLVRAKASAASRDEAMLRAIEIPMSGARAAVGAIETAGHSLALVPSFLLADLAAVIHLLAGAVSALLATVDYNLDQLSAAQPQIAEERVNLERQSQQLSRTILDKLP